MQAEMLTMTSLMFYRLRESLTNNSRFLCQLWLGDFSLAEINTNWKIIKLAYRGWPSHQRS